MSNCITATISNINSQLFLENTNGVTLTCVLHMVTLEFTVIGINGFKRSHKNRNIEKQGLYYFKIRIP